MIFDTTKLETGKTYKFTIGYVPLQQSPFWEKWFTLMHYLQNFIWTYYIPEGFLKACFEYNRGILTKGIVLKINEVSQLVLSNEGKAYYLNIKLNPL